MMNRNRISLLMRSSLAAGLLLVAGCASVGSLGNAPPSAMSVETTRMRGALDIVPTDAVGALSYAPLERCSYRQSFAAAGAAPVESQSALAIRRVRERLLITFSGPLGDSTALISPDGTLHDFNTIDFEGRRWTTENYQAQAGEQVRGAAREGRANVRMVNQLTSIFPQYRRGPWHPGDAVASVRAHDNQVWADYVYRGLTQYQGRQAAVLDLMARETASGQPVMVAFNLVDLETMAPLLYAHELGSKYRVERVSCP